MQSMTQSSFKQKEISQILFKPNFKAFWQSGEGFQRCGFLYPPPGDFIPPKSPGLIGLTKTIIQIKQSTYLLKKLKTFDSGYFRDKSHFKEDSMQNYLVFQSMYRYFK